MWRSSRIAGKLTILARGWLASPGRAAVSERLPTAANTTNATVCEIRQTLTGATCNQRQLCECHVETQERMGFYFSAS